MPAIALAEPQNKLIDIPLGITRTQLISPEIDDSMDPGYGAWKTSYILKVWRENMNAHGYYAITFFNGPPRIPVGTLDATSSASQGTDDDSERSSDYYVIGVNDENKTARAEIDTFQDAECYLTDYRLLFKGKTAYLIEADKKSDEFYCDTNKVTFIIYALAYNDGGDTNPPYVFVRQKTLTARKKYSSTGDAFNDEEKRLIKMAK